jgi:zinc finger protein
MLVKIPFFRDTIVMAFECSHCGFRNNQVQSAAGLADKGCRIYCRVTDKQDLNRMIVKSESCCIKLLELDFEIPPSTQSGCVKTIEGFLLRALEDLEQLQLAEHPKVYAAVTKTISSLKSYLALEGSCPFTVVLEDPSGNSFMENFLAPKDDPKLRFEYFTRTKEQLASLGYNDVSDTIHNNDEIPEIMQFPGSCSVCSGHSITKMHVINIPHFKETVIMATCCDSCGYRNNEIKASGPISLRGQRIRLKVTDQKDLSRDILKSDTCGMSIPEIGLELANGTLGGRFTTVEGILLEIKDQLTDRNPFCMGDSSQQGNQALQTILLKIDKVRRDKEGVFFIHSFIINNVDLQGRNPALYLDHG